MATIPYSEYRRRAAMPRPKTAYETNTAQPTPIRPDPVETAAAEFLGRSAIPRSRSFFTPAAFSRSQDIYKRYDAMQQDFATMKRIAKEQEAADKFALEQELAPIKQETARYEAMNALDQARAGGLDAEDQRKMEIAQRDNMIVNEIMSLDPADPATDQKLAQYAAVGVDSTPVYRAISRINEERERIDSGLNKISADTALMPEERRNDYMERAKRVLRSKDQDAWRTLISEVTRDKEVISTKEDFAKDAVPPEIVDFFVGKLGSVNAAKSAISGLLKSDAENKKSMAAAADNAKKFVSDTLDSAGLVGQEREQFRTFLSTGDPAVRDNLVSKAINSATSVLKKIGLDDIDPVELSQRAAELGKNSFIAFYLGEASAVMDDDAAKNAARVFSELYDKLYAVNVAPQKLQEIYAGGSMPNVQVPGETLDDALAEGALDE